MAKLFAACDHAGFALKEKIKQEFASHTKGIFGWTLKDLGPANDDRVDYPDLAQLLCRELLATASGEKNPVIDDSQFRGLLICGSGQGVAMAANRFAGIRAAVVWNEESAKLAREHNDANVLCLGARMTSPERAMKFIDIFLTTAFEGGRHTGRVAKLDKHK